MSFFWPNLLWLLLAPAVLLAWDLMRHRRAAAKPAHPKILRAEAGPHSLELAPAGAATGSVSTPRIRGWLFAGLSLAIVALARPQWGRIEEPVFDQSREILLAIDLSRSMLTPDVRPSRLERAKLLVQSLLEKLQGERVGLVVFSGTAFLQSPLSADYEILREFLPALNPDFLPEGGTNYHALIDTAVEAFGASGAADRFLIVLSDGEATDDDWKGQIEALKKKGVRVIGLGVGTAAGGMIPDGSGGLVKDQRGAVVLSKLESGTLQQLAQATGGVYRDASGWVDLAALIKETVNAGRKGQFVEKNTVRLVERFQWPLAFAVWCLLISAYYEFPVRPRVRDVVLKTGNQIPDTGNNRGRPANRPKGAALATVAMLAVLLFGFRFPASSFAAAAIAPPANSSSAPLPGDGVALGKIIGRIANQEQASATDYAEMARETLLWGQRLKEKTHHVPAGPVKDAIQAVDELMQMDSRIADWKKLRSDLEKLLEEDKQQKPPPQKQDQQKQQQQQQQDQQKQDQQDQNSPSPQDQQQKQQSPDQKKSSEKQDQPNSGKPEKQKPPGESAFGKMQDKPEQPPPPPPSNDTQKVGGTEQKKEDPREATDPTLALPLQKLDQLRNQDSPAQLFQLMDRDHKPPQKPAKDW